MLNIVWQGRFLAILALISLLPNSSVYAQKSRPNVLFIFVDDMRPDLGCYGNKEVQSPNIDKLANEGVLFNRHYVAVPTCGASRASILTGMYPRKVSQIGNEAMEKRASGKLTGNDPETFVEQFQRNGYHTVGIGKISHSVDGYLYGYDEPRSNKLELPNSWDEMLFDPGKWKTGWNAFFGYEDGSSRTSKKRMVKPYEAGDCDDEGYPDGLTSKLAIEKIKQLAQREQPFFLGVGFFKPHLPFNAPKKYWDMYDEESLSLTKSPGIPKAVNKESLHTSAEFNGYLLGDEKASLSGSVSDAYARKLRHAYYASISYTDAQVGKVLHALKEMNLDKNTIVVIWGDHGWHLGDDLVWGKHTLFEWSLRSTFIMKTPEMKNGKICDNVVSSVDIYPTLMELCGIKMPYTSDGQSMLPLLKSKKKPSWRDAALSYFKNGITIRTTHYRLTKYFRKSEPNIELYDHNNDPYEQKNVASENSDLVKMMLVKWKNEVDIAEKMYSK